MELVVGFTFELETVWKGSIIDLLDGPSPLCIQL